MMIIAKILSGFLFLALYLGNSSRKSTFALKYEPFVTKNTKSFTTVEKDRPKPCLCLIFPPAAGQKHNSVVLIILETINVCEPAAGEKIEISLHYCENR